MVVEWADGFRFTEKAALPDGFIKLARIYTPYHMANETDPVRRLGGRLCNEFEQKVQHALSRHTITWHDSEEQALLGKLIRKIGQNVWTALDTERHAKAAAEIAAVAKVVTAAATGKPSAPAVLGALLGGLAGAALGRTLGNLKDDDGT